ncbi:hypothetical protein BaRGS_00015214 [Batillaria attramentaria]|uniref:Uncharacterized protein n=1 Tax=Batillaria attramentaria TaxID=370345 RepID=A0ABD0L2P3_9CAEN
MTKKPLGGTSAHFHPIKISRRDNLRDEYCHTNFADRPPKRNRCADDRIESLWRDRVPAKLGSSGVNVITGCVIGGNLKVFTPRKDFIAKPGDSHSAHKVNYLVL